MTAAWHEALPKQGSPHVLAIDTSSFIHRSWHVMAADSAQSGAGALALRSFARIIRARQPSHIVFCGEGLGSFRTALWSGYKRDRKEKPFGLEVCEAYVAQALAGADVPLVSAAGLEADDVIAGVVRAVGGVIPVVIVSPDKDLEQLVDDFAGVAIWDGAQRVRREAEVLERRGVGPRQLGDLLALAGDATDGIPGVPGWGEKTAASVLASSPKPLADLLGEGMHWFLPAKYRRKFVEHRDQIKVSRELVRLRGDATAHRVHLDDHEVDPLRVADALVASADRWRGDDA